MRRIQHLLCAALTAVLLLSACALSAAPACAEDYPDGDYTVAFSMDGLGRHNVAWDTAAVHVKDGKLYVDFTLERVDPRNHPPQYEWLKTECGTFYPTLDEEAFTCTFSMVEVPHLGAVDVTAYSSAMSTEIDYTIHIDDSTLSATEPAPVDPDTPISSDDPEPPVDVVEPVSPDQPGEVITPAPGNESAPVSPETLQNDPNHLPLSSGAIIGIIAGAVAVLGVVVWLIVRNKKK